MNIRIKKIILSIMVLLNVIFLNAKDNKTLTLFVNGQGKTFEDAKSNCFRNAIEQAFGFYISSKTEILKDSLIKDEIISTSSGNIQEFDIISNLQLKNGTFLVSMNVVVSKSQLVNFCSKKAISLDFDATSLAASARLNNLYAENELRIIKTLEKELDMLLAEPFEFKMSYQLPKAKNGNNYTFNIPVDVDVCISDNFTNGLNYIMSALENVSVKLSKKDAAFDHGITNAYFIDFNNRQKEYFFRNDYVTKFVSLLSTKIRNKISDFELYLNDESYLKPDFESIDAYNKDRFLIGRDFKEGYPFGDIGLFAGGFDKAKEVEISTFRVNFESTTFNLSYFSKRCLGFYTAFPHNQPMNIMAANWRGLVHGEVAVGGNSFYPFTFSFYQGNTSKPFVLFSVAQESKSRVIAKHKINLRLSISQLENVKSISIKPGNNY
jgi:hypothetical protein